MEQDTIRKYNSTSSLYVNSIIDYPDVKQLIKSVSIILHSQLTEDLQLGKKVSKESDLYYFDEERYIEDYPHLFDEQRKEKIRTPPTKEEISEFIEALYNCAQFSPECCIICLVYINRIIALTGICLNPSNWRPLTLIALLIGQKVWDDKYLSNSDFAYIYPFFDGNQVNSLEMKFLEMIQYNTFIKSGMYTLYFLELRNLGDDEFRIKPLDKLSLEKLENQSKEYSEKKPKKAYSKSDDGSRETGKKSIIIIN